jgi:hypothetical protein
LLALAFHPAGKGLAIDPDAGQAIAGMGCAVRSQSRKVLSGMDISSANSRTVYNMGNKPVDFTITLWGS